MTYLSTSYFPNMGKNLVVNGLAGVLDSEHHYAEAEKLDRETLSTYDVASSGRKARTPLIPLTTLLAWWPNRAGVMRRFLF